MSKNSSYRQILRSSFVIGGASIINIIIGLLRIKAVAVLLGPAGVGLIGLMSSLVSTASTVAGLGFSNVGTRQIAEAVGHDDIQATAVVRKALFWGTLTLSLFGAIIFWMLRNVLAVYALGDATLANEVGWLALVVGLSVAAASQTALLNGLRQIDDLARISVLSALFSTAFGITALLVLGRNGLIAFVVAAPLSSFLLGHVYVARLPKIDNQNTPLQKLIAQWQIMAKLGATFMVAGLVGMLGQLIVRTLIQRELGADSLGYFHAASTISMTYIGFVLTAMGTDYYPRLTAVINDNEKVNKIVNEQTEIALLLAGPVLLAMMGLAPWVIDILYSNSFRPAIEILRWQILGDVLKIISWPLGFILLAAGNGREFLLTEIIASFIFVILSYFYINLFGLIGAGVAFFQMYIVYFICVHILAMLKTGFKLMHNILFHISIILFFLIVINAISVYNKSLGIIFTIIFSLMYAFYSFIYLKKLM